MRASFGKYNSLEKNNLYGNYYHYYIIKKG